MIKYRHAWEENDKGDSGTSSADPYNDNLSMLLLPTSTAFGVSYREGGDSDGRGLNQNSNEGLN